jgi:type IV pilus assembly protein PilO
MNMPFLDDIKNDPRKLAIAVGVVLLVLFLAYFNFILRPQVAQVSSLVAKMNSSRLDLKRAEVTISEIPKYRKDIALYEDKVTRYEKMLPAEREIPSLLENLSDMAKGSNVKIIGITPSVTAGEKGAIYQELPILINARSGFHELGRFLTSLEYSERFIKIADIDIKMNSSNPKKHDVDLLLLTYILLKGKMI